MGCTLTSIPTWTEDVLPSDFELTDSSIRSKIALAIMSYAAGDALGVQYEFIREKPKISALRIESKEGWPLGGVSDDTLLSLLTLSCLVETDSRKAGELFLEKTKAAIPKLRGLGPTTRAALGLPISENEKLQVGNTNGAMMRTALCGLAFKSKNSKKRDDWILSSASTTHQNANAKFCAVFMAALISYFASEDSPGIYHNLDIFQAIAKIRDENSEKPSELNSALLNVQKWTPPAEGISLDPIHTLLAVIWVVTGAGNFKDVYIRACELGGDTDTVAALSAALFAVSKGHIDDFLAMEWLSDIRWAEIGSLKDYINLVDRNRDT